MPTAKLIGALPGPLRTPVCLLRANTSLRERPDRLSAAVFAALPYGSSMLAAVAAAAARYPHATAIACGGERMSYRALWRGSNALARHLKKSGVTQQGTVAVLCRNSPTFVVALLAAAKIGADVVLLNTAMGAGQLADVITRETVGTVLHDEEYTAALSAVESARTISASQIQAITDALPGNALAPPRRDSRIILLTSGTTGRPKGAARSSGGGGAEGVSALLGTVPLRLRDTMVIPAPFFHALGLSALLLGLGLSATVVTEPYFDAARTLSLVAEHRARVLVVVPVMLERICALPAREVARANTDALRVVIASGSAIAGSLVTEILDRFGPVLYNIYGSTEVAIATVAGPKELRAHPTTAGRPAPGVRVRVVADSGTTAPPGMVGRVFVGGAARFDGYTGGGGKETLDGLLSTGDRGYFDAHGRLFVVGREDDMIVSGGENVYPIEVEELLNADSRIAEAVVVGIDDDAFGQALKAVIVVKPGFEGQEGALETELKASISGRLARFKVPRQFAFIAELPRTATGKVLRRQLAGPADGTALLP